MTIRISLALTLISLTAFSGCAQVAPVAAAPVGNPPATISEAVYPPGVLDTIRITGEYFKIKSDNKSDVIVSINGRNWTPAKKILASSPTAYVAVVPYGSSFPQVWVRVYGMNEEYSDEFLLHVERK